MSKRALPKGFSQGLIVGGAWMLGLWTTTWEGWIVAVGIVLMVCSALLTLLWWRWPHP